MQEHIKNPVRTQPQPHTAERGRRKPYVRISVQVNSATGKKRRVYRGPCAICGAPFDSPRPWALYCSDPCATEGDRRRKWSDQAAPPVDALACQRCGDPIPTARARRHAVYCSESCKRAARKEG